MSQGERMIERRASAPGRAIAPAILNPGPLRLIRPPAPERTLARAPAPAMVRARAPLRLGLAGGGTDVSPYCDIHGGSVLNATIDRYAYAVVRPTGDRSIRFEATDREQTEQYPETDFIEPTGPMSLHRAVYNEVVREFNGGEPLSITLSTFCDAPPGSGLGSSSTLVVVMLHAFAELLNIPIDDYDIAQRAFQIERVVCGLQGGRQDQYAAAFGGFNFIEFRHHEEAVVNPLRVKDWIVCELEASLLLYYTGVSRESARIIAEQTAGVTRGEPRTIRALHRIKDESLSMKDCLLKGDFRGIVESMRYGWESKKQSSPSVCSPDIESAYEAALTAGALAGKISGAGGGGYMLFFVPPDRRMRVSRELGRLGGTISNCHFTQYGSQAWRV